MGGEGIGDKILKLLSKHDYGLTIEDIANTLEINRMTASKYLAILEATKQIAVREVGKAKLHYPKASKNHKWLKLNNYKSSCGLNGIGFVFLLFLFFTSVIFFSAITTANLGIENNFEISVVKNYPDKLVTLEIDGPPLTDFSLTLINPENRSISPKGNVSFRTDHEGKYELQLIGFVPGDYLIKLESNGTEYTEDFGIDPFFETECNRSFLEYRAENVTNITEANGSVAGEYVWDICRDFVESDVTIEEVITEIAENRTFVEGENITNETIERSFVEEELNITEITENRTFLENESTINETIINETLERTFVEQELNITEIAENRTIVEKELNVTNVTETNESIPRLFIEKIVEFLPEKKKFGMNEKPKFKFTSKKIFSEQGRLIEEFAEPEVLDVFVYGPDQKLLGIKTDILKMGGGEYEIEISKGRAFRPGLYRIRMEVKEGEETYEMEDQFLWGLVSLNTRKSICSPGETTEFEIVVLDSEGHSVCDADLSLTVTDPNNGKTTYSTSEGTIMPAPECGVYNANYPTAIEGNHTIDITALIDGVKVDFSTHFLVLEEYEFDIIRNAKSKIDPTIENKFDVRIDIESFTDAKSLTIREFVPVEFNITNTDAQITTLGNTKILTWNKDLIKNKTFVEYSYSVPLVWPYLYELGPAELDHDSGTFREARPWYVAVDPVEQSEDLESGTIEYTGGLLNTTVFLDGFEINIDSNWTVTANWEREGSGGMGGVYEGYWDAKKITRSDPGILISKAVDISDPDVVAFYVDFYYQDDDCSAGLVWLEYNRSDSTWIQMLDLTDQGDDVWNHYSEKTTDSNYFHSGFAIQFNGGTFASGDNFWVDYVTIIKEEGDTDANKSYTTYENIPIDGLAKPLYNVTVTVNVSYYNSSGSSAKGSTNPDLWLEIHNGTDWKNVGVMGVTGTGNFSVSTQDSTILNSWITQSNRDIRIKGIYMDYKNSSYYDTIEYTDVWVSVNTTAPVAVKDVTVTPQKAKNGTSINITANITAGNAIDTARAMLYFPNGSFWQNATMTGSGNIYYNETIIANFDIPGQYNVTIWANDSQGNVNSTEKTWFAPYLNLSDEQEIVINGSFTDWSGVTVVTDNGTDAGTGGGGLDNELLITGLNDDYGNITIFEYNSTSKKYEQVWTNTTTGWGSQWSGGEMGDLTHDGKNDFVISRRDASNYFRLEVWSYNSSSGDWYQLWYTTSSSTYNQFFIGDIADFDNDGKNELLIGNKAISDFEVWGNDTEDATGFSLNATVLDCDVDDSDFLYHRAACNMDGDDYPELILPCYNTDTIQIFEWNGSDYEHQQDVTIPTMVIDDMECGDVDRDGEVEVVYCGNDYKSHVLDYSGGTYSVVYNTSSAGQLTQTCSIGDVTNDGWPDWFDVSRAGVRVFSYNGSGYESVWSKDMGWSTGAPPIGGSFAGDADNDEWVEFIFGGTSDSDTIYLFENDTVNATSFNNTLNWTVVGSNPNLIIGDFDSDAVGGGGGGGDFDITNVSLANNDTYLFARIGVNGSIDVSEGTNYYRMFISTDDSVGNETSPEDEDLPFKYDYRVQVNGSECYVFNYSDYSNNVSSCLFNYSGAEMEIAVNLTVLGLSAGENANITFQTGSTNPGGYDLAPDGESFLSYDVPGAPGDTSPTASLGTNPVPSLNDSDGSIVFDLKCSDDNGVSVLQLWGNWSGWHANETNSSPVNNAWWNVTVSGIPEGVWKWDAWCNDTIGQGDWSNVNRTFTVDLTNPNASMGTNPTEGYEDTDGTITFDLKCSDNTDVDTLQLWGNWSGTWEMNQTNSTPINDTWWNVTVSGIPEGTWKWGVYCNDSLGREDWSDDNRTLTVDFSSQCTPPADDDWNISTSCTKQNEIITMAQDKSLNVNNGGSLTLINVTLLVNSTSDGNSEIRVWSGGEMNITDNSGDGSLINSTDTDYEFAFVVDSGSTFSMTNSHLSEVGWSATEGQSGLEINTTVTEFSGNTLTNNRNGVIFDSSNNNIINNTAHSNDRYGIYLASNNNNLTNNTLNSNDRSGIILYYSSDNTLTNNTANSNDDCGIYLYYSNSNNLTDNTADSNIEYGIHLYYSDSNNLTDNTADSNGQCGIYLEDSKYIELIQNTITDNMYDIYDDYGGYNNFYYNKFTHNIHNVMIDVDVNNQTPNVNDMVEFNVSVSYPNGTDCSAFTYNITTRPYETVNTSVNGNEISGNFTVTEQGFYSLIINVTDDINNTVVRNYAFIVNATTRVANYYFRAVSPTHGQPIGIGTDAKSLLLTPPTTEESWTCSGWVQASPDDLAVPASSFIKDINMSFWYTLNSDTDTGVERYVTYDNTVHMDYSTSIPSAGTYTWFNANFSVNWSMDYARLWYWLGVKFGEGFTVWPKWYTNQTDPSYVNISYLYSITPEIKNNTNTDVLILSATSPASDTKNATIYLDGSGSTNLTVQMPNTTINYSAKMDGNDCNDANCNLTSQANGELNFTLTLGSEHNITIEEEEEDAYPTASLGTNPVPYLNDSDGSIVFDLKCSDDNGADVLQLWGNWSGWHANETNSSPGNDAWWNKTVSGIPEGVWKWDAWCNDTIGQEDWAEENRTFTVDLTNPTAEMGTNPVDYINDSDGSITFDLKCSDNFAPDTLQLWGNWTGTWTANQTNSTPYNDTFWNKTATGIPEGTWRWGVYCNDSSGREAWSTANRTLTVDLTDPQIGGKYINESGSVYTDTVVCLNVSGVSDNVGVDTVWTTITQSNGSVFNATMSDTGDCAGIADDGWYSVNVNVGDSVGLFSYNTTYVNDSSGRINTNTTVLNLTTQDAPPTASLGTNPVAYYNDSDGSITFDLKCSDDNGADVLELWGNWSGWHANETNSSPTNNGWWNVTVNGIPEGTWKWDAWCNDTIGQADWSDVNRTFTVDLTNPTAEMGTNPVDYINDSDGTITFDLKCSDNLDVDTLQLWGNWSGGWSAKETNSTPYNDTFWNKTVSGIPEGTWKWGVYCNDSSGREAWSTNNRTLTVDSQDPQAEMGTNPVDYINDSDGTITFDLKCSDNLDVDTLQLWGNWTGTWEANQTNSTPYNDTFWNKTVSGIPDGVWKWAVYCNDSSGREAWSASNRTLTVDLTNPNASMGTNPPDDSTDSDGTVTFDLKCSDNLDVDTLQLWGNWSGWHANETNSSPVNNAWWNVTVSGIPAGTWKWGVYCNDSAGNNDWSDTNRTLTIDYPPNVNNVTVTPQKAKNATNINITANVTDNNGVSAVKAMLYYPNGTFWQNATMTGSGDIYSNETITVNFYPHGTYNVTIWANDTGGNVNSTEKTWFAPYLNLSDTQEITINGDFTDWVGVTNMTDVVGDSSEPGEGGSWTTTQAELLYDTYCYYQYCEYAMFNISDISGNSSSDIANADIWGYSTNVGTSNDITVWRIMDTSWDETTDCPALNGYTLNTTGKQTTTGVWTSVSVWDKANITNVLKSALDSGETKLAIRLHGNDSTVCGTSKGSATNWRMSDDECSTTGCTKQLYDRTSATYYPYLVVNFTGYGNDFDLSEVSLANNDTYLFANIQVNGSIDVSEAAKYYRMFISTNDSTGNETSPENEDLPFKYDYRVQVNGSACYVFNYSDYSNNVSWCLFNYSGSEMEIGVNLTVINLSLGDSANISFQTGSMNPGGYDSAPDGESFLSYNVSETELDIHLISPPNETKIPLGNQIFNCSIADSDGIANLTLYIWNSTGSNIHKNTTNLTGTQNETGWDYTFPYKGTFEWNCLGYDNIGNSAWSEEGNYTITVDDPPTASLGTNPPEGYVDPDGTVTFDLKCSDDNGVSFLQLWGNWTGTWEANQTNSTPINDTFWNVTVSGIPEGTWKWDAWCNDTIGQEDWSAVNRTFTVFDSAPSVINVSVVPQKALNATNINISTNVTDDISVDNVIAMIYYPNGTFWQNLTMINNSDIYWNETLTVNFYPHGTYNVTIWANDTGGNVNSTEKTWFAPYLNLSDTQEITINGSFTDWSGVTVVTDIVGDSSEPSGVTKSLTKNTSYQNNPDITMKKITSPDPLVASAPNTIDVLINVTNANASENKGFNWSINVSLWNTTKLNTLNISAWNYTDETIGSDDLDTLIAADLDNDGDIDITTGDRYNQVYILVNPGNENSTDISAWNKTNATASGQVKDIAVADIDNDGDSDIISGDDGEQVYIWENPGNSMNISAWNKTNATASGNLYGVTAADLDNDGDIDIISVDEGYQTYIWENPGNENSTNISTWSKTNAQARSSAVYAAITADIDDDGDVDIIIGSSSYVHIWENPGNENSTDISTWNQTSSAGTCIIRSLAATDVNNDGDIDILSGHACADLYLFENPGNENSTNISTWSKTNVNLNDNPQSIDAADLDNDGDNDLTVGRGSRRLYILDNPGNESSNDITTWDQTYMAFTGSSNPLCVDTADVDSDGDEDIISGTSLFEVFIFENSDVSSTHINSETKTFINQSGNATTYSLSWTPEATGNYTLMAIADNNGRHAEVLENDNRIVMNVTVSVGGGDDFDLANVSLANNETFLFARIGVNGSINVSEGDKYYRMFISVNDSVGNETSPENEDLPFKYDYRVQVNGSACYVFNYSDYSNNVSSCLFNYSGSEMEIAVNLSVINLSAGEDANITFQTGSTNPGGYDSAPDGESFLSYDVSEVACNVDFTMTTQLSAGIRFAEQDPDQANVSAIDNGDYNVTDNSNSGCGTVNVSIRATSDLVNGSSTIGIGNVTVNSTSPGSGVIQLSTEYQLIRSGVTAGESNVTTLYFWLTIPSGQDPKDYNTTIYIMEEKE